MYRGKDEQDRYLEHFPYEGIPIWLFWGEIRRAKYIPVGPPEGHHKHASARDLIGFWAQRQTAETKLNF
jgi:hypothetical protein